MKIGTYFLLIWFSLVAIAGVAADNQDNAHFRIGSSARTFGGLNKNDAAAALLAWAKSIVKERNLDIRPEMTIFNRFEDLRKAFLAGEFDAANLNVEEVMDLGWTPEAVFLPVLDQGLHVRYALVVHSEAGIQEARDLWGGKLSIHDSSLMTYGLPWVETLMTNPEGTQSPRQPGILTKVENPSKAVFQVFFRQVNGAVVTTDAFELACELNPQLGKDLKILAVSPPFIPYAFVFQTMYQGWSRNEIEMAMLELGHTVGGQQLMTAMQCAGMEKHPVSVLGPTMEFITRYRSLTQVTIFKEDNL